MMVSRSVAHWVLKWSVVSHAADYVTCGLEQGRWRIVSANRAIRAVE